MAEINPQHSDETMDTHWRYLVLALRRHSNDIANLNEKTVDAVYITSSILRVTTFIMLRDRSLNSYTSPVSWLQMMRGAVDVFKVSWKWIANDKHSIASRLAKRMPVLFDDEAKFGASYRQGLLHLLQRDDEDVAKERWHAKDQEAYEIAVSYIGGI
jgi:hypothetical protein